MTDSVLTCIDGSIYAASVADHAGWAARRLGAPVRLLQVLGRREAESEDRSGRIEAGARRRLLEQLADLDAERAKLLREQARLDLEAAAERLAAAGVDEVSTTLRHGDLLEALHALEEAASLIVVGKRGAAADFAALHLGSNLERILRTSARPVLVASRAFRPVERCLIAFDARPSAERAVEAVAASPLFAGLGVQIVMAGEADAAARAALDRAVERLRSGGIEAEGALRPGGANEAIPAALAETGSDLLVMGAYGHSRLRTLVIGSTTSEMIRACRVPILVYR